MILMMSFVGLRGRRDSSGHCRCARDVRATLRMYYLSYRLWFSYRLWYRFRDLPWQRIVRRGLAPLTIGLVIAGGYVMARSAAIGWQSVAITAAAMALMLGTRLNPLWILTADGVLGGLGLL